MKKIIVALPLIALFFISDSCDDTEPSPAKGSATFTFSHTDHINPGGRVKQIPATGILLSIQDDHGKEMVTDKKVALFPFGEGYTTESLELNTGTYNLTKFLVLDSANNVIYATPFEDADLAQFVNDPLPIHFSIRENESTKIVPQVLMVAKGDMPTHFGYASFDFEIVERPDTTSLFDLPVILQNDGINYDSVYITLSSSGIVKKQRLILNSTNHVASGIVRDLQSGPWTVSISYFTSLVHNEKSEVEIGSATVTITSAALNLFSNGATVFINNSSDAPEEKVMRWDHFYAFYLFGKNKLAAIVTLPVDPLNPLFGISLLNRDWDYFYADRSFYNAKEDEPDSHYHQGSAALERYNYDKISLDYIDTTSFKKVTDEVRNKTWNMADCLVIFYVKGQEQPIFYYEWDFRNLNGGRKAPAGMPFTREQVNARRHSNVK